MKEQQSIATRRYPSPIDEADWTLTAYDVVAIQVSLAVHRLAPGWQGATDAQLQAVAADIIAALDQPALVI